MLELPGRLVQKVRRDSVVGTGSEARRGSLVWREPTDSLVQRDREVLRESLALWGQRETKELKEHEEIWALAETPGLRGHQETQAPRACEAELARLDPRDRSEYSATLVRLETRASQDCQELGETLEIEASRDPRESEESRVVKESLASKERRDRSACLGLTDLSDLPVQRDLKEYPATQEDQESMAQTETLAPLVLLVHEATTEVRERAVVLDCPDYRARLGPLRSQAPPHTSPSTSLERRRSSTRCCRWWLSWTT